MKQTGKNRVVIQCQECPARMEQRTLRNGLEWLVAGLKRDWDMRHNNVLQRSEKGGE